MYPVKLGIEEAKKRINTLIKNGHHAEALVTSMFTVEKTLRRTLRQIIVSAGFTSKQSDKIISNLRGLDSVKNSWELYEPNNKKLTDLISQEDWKQFRDVATMRNKMIHGERVYNLDKCKNEAINVLKALDKLKDKFDNVYGYSGWETYSKRIKSKLHSDPKVNT